MAGHGHADLATVLNAKFDGIVTQQRNHDEVCYIESYYVHSIRNIISGSPRRG